MLLFRAVAITLATSVWFWDNAYTLNGVRITRRADGGLQVLYPHLAEREGKRRQIFAFKPMNPIAHKRIEQAVLSAYKEELRKTGSTSGF